MLYVLVVVGFVLLMYGGNLLVDGSVAVAKKMRVSSLLIGLTLVGQQAVILRMLVAVRYQHAQGRSRCLSLEYTAFNDISVFFLTLGAHLVLSRGAPRHFFFYKHFINRRSRR